MIVDEKNTELKFQNGQNLEGDQLSNVDNSYIYFLCPLPLAGWDRLLWYNLFASVFVLVTLMNFLLAQIFL